MYSHKHTSKMKRIIFTLCGCEPIENNTYSPMLLLCVDPACHLIEVKGGLGWGKLIDLVTIRCLHSVTSTNLHHRLTNSNASFLEVSYELGVIESSTGCLNH